MIQVILIFLVFALIHSITVTWWFKNLCREIFGATFMRVSYRFLYNIVSAVTTGVAFYLIAQVPDIVLWRAPEGLRWYMYFIQIGGLVFGAGAFQYLDGLEFLGIKQVWRYLTRREVAGNLEGLTEKELVTSGVYSIVRHPMYLAGIIIFTFNPNITVNSLTVTVLADLYFLWGVFIEERRFLRIFGDRYREYMKRVPRLIPKIL